MFVNNLDAGSVPGATTTTEAAASSTTTTAATTTTTTTTLGPEVQAFVDTIELLRAEASELADEAESVNSAWDAGDAGFGATRDALDAIRARAGDLATAANGVELPDSFPGTWDEIAASADDMAAAANGMFEGFIGPSSEPRRTALVQFTEAATAMVEALDAAEADFLSG